MTRRMLLFAFAAEFWSLKRYSQWTDEEVARMLTDSPWAKQVGPYTALWLSAAPIQMAIARRDQGSLSVPEAPRVQKTYTIGVAGVAEALIPHDRRELRETLLSAATLRPKGKHPMSPDDVRTSSGRLEFQFPKDDPIGADVKEIEFAMRVGAANVRCKFRPADMLFEGRLAL